MTTEKIAAALRWCGTGTEESCDDCAFEPQRDEDAVGCVGGLCDAAADKIEELVDRCARYAEEIAVLRERVRLYEEAGLTADVCAEYRKFEDEVVASGNTFERLLELLRADADGRVVVLSCKVGDTVYRVFAPGDRKPVILETQVKTLGEAAGLIGRIGKPSRLVSVFLTRGEAEKALEAWTHGTD